MVASEAFITCAVTGAGDNHRKSDRVPITPRQIAEAALEAASAGAAIVHIHVRDPETGEGSRETRLYREVMERLRAAQTDVIINLTAGMGGDLVFGERDPLSIGPESDLVGPLERLVHVEELRPEICSLDCGSYNVGTGNLTYIATSDYVRRGAERIRELGVKPELEIFELGHMTYATQIFHEGLLERPALFQFCHGIPYGAPATPRALMAMLDLLPPEGAVWSAFGVGRMEMPMVAQALLLGGNVRVGLEDNLYLRRGVRATNGQLVERAVNICEALNVKVLGPQEVRSRLGLPGLRV